LTLEEQFARLIKTLQLIEREPLKWDVAGLELAFGVGRATVERDIRILRQWGTIERKDGYFAIKQMQFLPTTFTPSEALSLVLAGSVAADRISLPHSDALTDALKKIDALLPEQVESMVKKMRKRVSIGIKLVRDCDADVLDMLSKAISFHNPIDIDYHVAARGELTRRKVDPYGLTFRFGAWYLIGFCHMRESIRTFGLDRIRAIRVLDEHFRYPKDFDLEEYLKRGWSLQSDWSPCRIRLRFCRELAGWIEGCTFHPGQKITREAAGTSIFEVNIAGWEEIKHWVLGFGDRVEVLEPAELRDAVAETAARMSLIYAPSGAD
jgi:predicted DNA-binding transcriptional regulator YafY